MAETTTLYYKIYHELKTEIETGKRKEGEKLPSEKELSAMYQVSRITSRKALAKLSEEKLVIRKAGVGTLVAVTPETGDNEKNSNPYHATIGLIVEWVDEAFGLSYLYEIDKYANTLGYKILYAFTYGDQDKEKAEIHFMHAQNVSGIIIMPCHGQYYNPEILKMALEGFPILFFDRNLDGIPVNYVVTDNQKGSMLLVDHALQQGHTNLAMITSDTSTISVNERVMGYVQACEESDYPANANRVFKLFNNTKPTFETKNIQKDYERICEIIEATPDVTCYIFTEHELAVSFEAAYKQFKQCAQLPVELYSFDCNINYFGGCVYTHIHQDEKSLAMESVNQLHHLITTGKSYLNRNSIVQGTLIEKSFVGDLDSLKSEFAKG